MSMVDNKPSIHFGKDDTKYILFFKIKRSSNLNASYEDHLVQYLACHLDSNVNLKGKL